MIHSVSRASSILRMLGEGKNRLTDISRSIGLNMSTTHRLLKTLEEDGFVVQDPVTHQYLLGPVILQISSNPIIAHQVLVVSVQGEMERLRNLTGETVTINTRLGTQRVCLEEIESAHNIKFTIGRGSISPIYAGSAGKVLLAELPKKELEVLLLNIELRPIGPKTITDERKLMKELEKIRRDGYAVSLGEKLEGGRAISVPVKGYVCPVSLTILGPEFRFGSQYQRYIKELQKSAGIISRRIVSLKGSNHLPS